MKIARTVFVLTSSLLLTISAFGYFLWYKPKFTQPVSGDHAIRVLNAGNEHAAHLLRIKKQAGLAKDYVFEHGLDNSHCFLLDMRIPSGKARFFVYNLAKDSVELAGLVTHGSGSDNGSADLSFSNIPNSYSTSLGKYKIGNSYNGIFGMAYKLHGLEKSNSNAFDRFIVLHAHECVPNNEVYPFQICLSQGCPTVSPSFLKSLKDYISETTSPIMLWIYY